MSKYSAISTIKDKPPPAVIRTIALFAEALGIHEPIEEKLINRQEARDRMYELKQEITRKRLWRRVTQLRKMTGR